MRLGLSVSLSTEYSVLLVAGCRNPPGITQLSASAAARRVAAAGDADERLPRLVSLD
jgi:hypothetical protein